ncbi:uncharacterized protein LOC118103420 isoform X2 [Hippoglossus stenolepis]|uniref:uncharacterized protein LOC118103420 isoform X2 n=1 Tax=Hippoglossus stenolepis TaxID=195615 RepID=UPI00159C9680|nr:uncharacterized protein LOC118103420 isoform X2 [Hippoglossus stenolepis]
MWQIVCALAALLALVSSQAELKLQKKVGDDVVLSPGSGSVTGSITKIIWKDGLNIAVQWEAADSDVTYYRHFKERGSLNTSSGAMTIRGLTQNDSKLYTPEINSVMATPTLLTVLAPVPVPTVTTSCNEEKSSCTLTCDGNVKDVKLVIYNWKSDDVQLTNSSKDHHVEKENSLSVKEFSCELENPVSRESSEPIANPFITDTTKAEWKLNINTGLIVFISLLGAVLLLVLVHRWKAGMWFFQKESMPWEADFWSKHERGSRDAESNGTTRREREQTDEETAMT